jgi:hypothetical protein
MPWSSPRSAWSATPSTAGTTPRVERDSAARADGVCRRVLLAGRGASALV